MCPQELKEEPSLSSLALPFLPCPKGPRSCRALVYTGLLSERQHLVSGPVGTCKSYESQEFS